MRRLAAFLAVIAVAVAGCGGGGTGSSLDAALGYLPADAPVALIVSTELDGDGPGSAGGAVRELPFGPLLLELLKSGLAGGDVDFDDDIAPLLGNELVVGVADPASLGAGAKIGGLVAALRVEDRDALARLAGRLAEQVGETEGATLYRDGGAYLAVDGEMLVVAGSEQGLRAALEREDDDRLREDDVADALERLPADAPARLLVDVGALLDASPATASLRQVPFLGSLDRLAAAVTIADGRAALDVAVTGKEKLADDALPVARGGDAPALIGGEDAIAIGVRDGARMAAFAQQVAEAISPRRFARLEALKRQIASRAGVDLDRDLLGLLRGDASLAIGLDGGFALRAELEDGDAFRRTLERVMRVLPDVVEDAGLGDVGVSGPTGGNGFYAFAREDGEGVVFGIVDGVLVLAGEARRAADLISERPRPVEGAEGALVVRADAARLLSALFSGLAELLGGAGIELPLGALTGSLAADRDGLRGRLSLELSGR